MGTRLCNVVRCPEHSQPGAMEPQPVSPQPHKAPTPIHLPFTGLLDTPQSPTTEGQRGNRVGPWGWDQHSSATLVSAAELQGYSLREE